MSSEMMEVKSISRSVSTELRGYERYSHKGNMSGSNEGGEEDRSEEERTCKKEEENYILATI